MVKTFIGRAALFLPSVYQLQDQSASFWDHIRSGMFCAAMKSCMCNDSFIILGSKFGMTISLHVSYFTTYFVACDL